MSSKNGCTCFICTHEDPALREAYLTGQVEILKTAILALKQAGVRPTAAATDSPSLGRYLSCFEYDLDACESLLAELHSKQKIAALNQKVDALTTLKGRGF